MTSQRISQWCIIFMLTGTVFCIRERGTKEIGICQATNNYYGKVKMIKQSEKDDCSKLCECHIKTNSKWEMYINVTLPVTSSECDEWVKVQRINMTLYYRCSDNDRSQSWSNEIIPIKANVPVWLTYNRSEASGTVFIQAQLKPISDKQAQVHIGCIKTLQLDCVPHDRSISWLYIVLGIVSSLGVISFVFAVVRHHRGKKRGQLEVEQANDNMNIESYENPTNQDLDCLGETAATTESLGATSPTKPSDANIYMNLVATSVNNRDRIPSQQALHQYMHTPESQPGRYINVPDAHGVPRMDQCPHCNTGRSVSQPNTGRRTLT